jgi:hypothetical protein
VLVFGYADFVLAMHVMGWLSDADAEVLLCR